MTMLEAFAGLLSLATWAAWGVVLFTALAVGWFLLRTLGAVALFLLCGLLDRWERKR